MANSAPIRFLSDVSGANTPTDLLLPAFGGEVLAAHNRFTSFIPRVNSRTIDNGIQLNFPETWRISSERHEAGTELLGLDVETHERTISLDTRPLVSHFDIDDIDEMLAHFSVRSEFSMKMGEALANGADRRAAMLLVLASRDAGNGSLPGGNEQTDGNTATANATGAKAILDAIDAQVLYWDENDVPVSQRYCAVKWDMYHQLRKIDIVGVVSTGTPAFGGSLPGMTVAGADNIINTRPATLAYAGVEIFGTNNLPAETVVADGYEDNYAGVFDNTTAIMWQKDAVAWLTKAGLGLETARDSRRGTDFFKTSMLFGGGTLRPEAAGSVKSA